MGRNLSPIMYRELENLDKHPDSRREAMKALKSYVKDLDSKAIPTFLARVSETKEPGSASGEFTISLFEVLARSHGRNIVPYIDNMMDTIMKTLSTGAGSFALHQACSKVVSTIIRYGINPLITESEKTRIIRSLCKPFSDVLMGPQESTASGAALCLTALVESDNWRFASDNIVNEICLKVAGALGETRTQTNSHMGLVMVLSKHNSLIADAYARSFIRSGLQILTSSVEARNSQKRLSAVQMINFLMKFVDSRSISSEIGGIIDVMEKSQNDHMPFVRGAAFEALQTAKIITGQQVSQHEVSSSPILTSSLERRTDRNNSQTGSQVNGEPGDSTSSSEFPTQELQSVDSFDDYDTYFDSPLSIGQSSCNFECGRRAGRRLWNNVSSVNVSLSNGLSNQASSRSDGPIVHSEGHRENELSEVHKEHSVKLLDSVQPSVTNVFMRSSNSSPQRSRQFVDDVRRCSTPCELIESLQNHTDVNSDDLERQRRMLMIPTSTADGRNQDDHSHIDEVQGRSNPTIIRANMQQSVSVAEPMTTRAKILRYSKVFLSFICGLLIIILAIILSDNDETVFVVPT